MLRAYVRSLGDNFGWRFLAVLASAYLGVKGLVNILTIFNFLPYFRDVLDIRGAQYQAMFTVARLPSSLKALIGMLSDTVPIGGYHKRYYIVLSGLVGGVACTLLAVLPVQDFGGGALAASLVFLVSLEAATVDLLIQGVYAKLMVSKPETGADLVSAAWGFFQVGGFIAAGLVGGLVGRTSPRVLFWVTLPAALQIIVPVLAGWLPEDRTTVRFRGDRVRANAVYFGLGAAMGAAALGLGAVSLFGDTVAQAAYSLSVSAVLVVASLWFLPKRLGRAMTYLFLAATMDLNIRGAVDFFYTANEECLPDGPAFTLSFYLAWTGMIGSVAGMLGVALFQAFLSRSWYRRAFWVTTLLQVAAATVDIVIVQRWNRRVGISDRVFYILGGSMLQEVVYMLDFMPSVVLISKLCPPGVESTVYALLAGFSNFGVSVASALGALAIDQFGIRARAPCDFGNLAWLIFAAKMVLPLLTVPLTFFLIPDARMTDDLVGALTPAGGGGGGGEDGGSVKDGSAAGDGDDGGSSVSGLGASEAGGSHA